ncbi:hypothetical protein ABI59_17075 [Acidobacteria bacterium Mor1]|nr:hypothetical protein ABI59_17075 [Acidobacteria bacterium Mor1]
MTHRSIAKSVFGIAVVLGTLIAEPLVAPVEAKTCEDCVVYISYGVRQICFSQRKPDCFGKMIGSRCGRGGTCQEFRPCAKRPAGACCKCIYRFETPSDRGLEDGSETLPWTVPGMLQLGDDAMLGSCIPEPLDAEEDGIPALGAGLEGLADGHAADGIGP